VYADDFTGSRLNTSAWTQYTGAAPSNSATAFWSPSHVNVANGTLTIAGSVDRTADPAGRIVTDGIGLWHLPGQTYGKWEVLVRVDQCPQVKYAWMLWPSSNSWPAGGEVDFAEDHGGDRSGTLGSVIYAGAGGQAATLPQNHLTPSTSLSNWHVVGVEWTPGQIRYTVDGAVWASVTSAHVPTNPMTLVLQTESLAGAGSVPAGFGCNAQLGWVVQYAMG